MIRARAERPSSPWLPRLVVLVALAVATLGAAGCGAAAAVRPAEITGHDAMGEKTCKDEGLEHPSPLIIDWATNERSDLEQAMDKNLAVLAYSCGEIRLLPNCHIDGTYGYFARGDAAKDSFQVKNDSELKANLPRTAFTAGVQVDGELSRGASIDVALAEVGARTSTRFNASVNELTGDCQGATHFVRAAHVGAFAMETGTQAKVRVTADIFSVGGSANDQSERKTSRSDGKVAQCDQAKAGMSGPPEGCAAILRLDLVQLARQDTSLTGSVNPGADLGCPKGMVLAGGKCTTDRSAPHRCVEDDLADCVTQCDDQNNAESCKVLGDVYFYGRGNEKNTARAYTYYKKACDGGAQSGCAEVGGSLVYGGDGVPIDAKKGLELIKTSCERGAANGCILLGGLYVNGKAGLPRDQLHAMTAFTHACDAGYAEGCANVGVNYLLGLGVPRDSKRAFGYLRRGCDGGSGLSCSNLSQMYRGGEAIEKDLVRALELSAFACDLGDPSGCYRLGSMYQHGEGVTQNVAWATRLFADACTHQSHGACNALAIVKLNGAPGVERDEAGSAALFRRLCDQKELAACNNLGTLYAGGQGVAKDMRQANALKKIACDGGIGEACNDLGMYLLDGKGGARELPRAAKLFKLACDRGSQDGCANARRASSGHS